MVAGNLLKMFVPEFWTPFCTRVSDFKSLCRLFFDLVLILCTELLVGNRDSLFATNFIKEYIYCEAVVRIPSSLNRFLHDVLEFTPQMSLITRFCTLKTFAWFDELPQNMIPYDIIE